MITIILRQIKYTSNSISTDKVRKFFLMKNLITCRGRKMSTMSTKIKKD